MQIKVFKAGTMKEAMAAMKAELGDDAVILHSKKYKEGGLLGLGSKEIVEITAAVEESALPNKPDTPHPISAKPSLMSNSMVARYKTSGTAQGIAQAERDIEDLNSPEENFAPPSTSEMVRSSQADELAEKIAAQNKAPTLKVESDEPQDFGKVLNDATENLPEEDTTQEEIQTPAYNEPVEKSEEPLPTEEVSNESVEEETSEPVPEENSTAEQMEETQSEEENSSQEMTEEKISEPEEAVEEKVEEKVEETPHSQENVQPEENIQPAENVQPSLVEKPKEEVSKSEEIPHISKQQANSTAELTPAQLAQTQMMMAQLNQMNQMNQMQMTQIMQQAMAQAQAQANAQVAEMAEQMRRQQAQFQAAQSQAQTSQEKTQPLQTSQEDEKKIQRLEDEVAQMKRKFSGRTARRAEFLCTRLCDGKKSKKIF